MTIDQTAGDPRQIKATKPDYKNLYEQLEFGRFNSVKSGAAPTVYQEITSVQGQQDFTLNIATYVVGDHSLQVFVNGQMMREGAENDYEEITNQSIRFTFGLDDGDVVVLRVNGGTSGASLHENHRALATQTVFHLTGSYATGNHSLVVFVNGAYQTLSEDYLETDAKTVTFTEPLEENDLVTFRVEGLPSVQSTYKSSHTERTYDNNRNLIREERTADGIHVVKEFLYDAEGRPERMVTREAGFILTKTYTWLGFECVSIVEDVKEG